MGIKIYNKEGRVFVETDGIEIDKITEIELHFTTDKKDSRILFLSYNGGIIQQAYNESSVDWIELNALGGYSIIGSGIQPNIIYEGKTLSRIEEAKFIINSESPKGVLELKIVVRF